MRQRYTIMVAMGMVWAMAGCHEPADFVYGARFDDVLFVPHSESVGVYPDESVLDDPANAFALSPPTLQGKWDIQAEAGPVPAFYAWATVLAKDPSGEAQFYAAFNLREIYLSGQAAQPDLVLVRELALAGFQAVLDHFPESVTYDETGTWSWDLATPSFIAMQELGGTVEGGWVLFTDANGVVRAVQP